MSAQFNMSGELGRPKEKNQTEPFLDRSVTEESHELGGRGNTPAKKRRLRLVPMKESREREHILLYLIRGVEGRSPLTGTILFGGGEHPLPMQVKRGTGWFHVFF